MTHAILLASPGDCHVLTQQFVASVSWATTGPFTLTLSSVKCVPRRRCLWSVRSILNLMWAMHWTSLSPPPPPPLLTSNSLFYIPWLTPTIHGCFKLKLIFDTPLWAALIGQHLPPLLVEQRPERYSLQHKHITASCVFRPLFPFFTSSNHTDQAIEPKYSITTAATTALWRLERAFGVM